MKEAKKPKKSRVVGPKTPILDANYKPVPQGFGETETLMGRLVQVPKAEYEDLRKKEKKQISKAKAKKQQNQPGGEPPSR